ncbi:cell division protein FtsA [Lacticaseibacillus songhuajiangensis]|jgi:cell division protein FtsA|uniref:cell division protein FtsA n=1 Tax=Lacticaseibacillus songhuajiangensis TaxID=1296539 RepID=UPI000F7B1FB1|nr:cell division protein FtsA [Lacticaseibacillus songhuajiangensis]
MGNQGIYVGLDVGTTSIKAIAAEVSSGQMHVIGVGSQRADGLARGVIVDIDKAVASIQAALEQAAKKASIQIDSVIAGVPASMLQIEKVSGLIAVGDTSREITDDDVRNVAASALTRNLPPEREILSLIPDEFIVDGFDGIKDPRGMIGVRLEMKGLLLTVPKTVLHNITRAVEKAGYSISAFIANPLALGSYILSDGEQDFGTVVIDLGGGQSTAAVIHDHKLKFTTEDLEGGDYITKDISVVLNTSVVDAERLKREYGNADSLAASEEQTFPVTVVGKSAPATISEKYLAEIIEARLTQIFGRLNETLTQVHALDLPGGIVITGGTTALPGVIELAQDIFNRQVRRFIPNEVGLRHPAFTQALALINAAANMTDVEIIAGSALRTPLQLQTRQTPAPASTAQDDATAAPQQAPAQEAEPEQDETDEPKEKKPSIIKRFFGTFFE